jgi:hypothetical protein
MGGETDDDDDGDEVASSSVAGRDGGLAVHAPPILIHRLPVSPGSGGEAGGANGRRERSRSRLSGVYDRVP